MKIENKKSKVLARKLIVAVAEPKTFVCRICLNVFGAPDDFKTHFDTHRE